MHNFKQPRWNSEAYAAWIRTFPCFASEKPNVEAAHVHAKGMGGGAKSMFGNLVPMEQSLHRLQHQKGWGAFEEKTSLSKAMVKRIARGFTERYMVDVINPKLERLRKYEQKYGRLFLPDDTDGPAGLLPF